MDTDDWLVHVFQAKISLSVADLLVRIDDSSCCFLLGVIPTKRLSMSMCVVLVEFTVVLWYRSRVPPSSADCGTVGSVLGCHQGHTNLLICDIVRSSDSPSRSIMTSITTLQNSFKTRRKNRNSSTIPTKASPTITSSCSLLADAKGKLTLFEAAADMLNPVERITTDATTESPELESRNPVLAMKICNSALLMLSHTFFSRNPKSFFSTDYR
jgi:hypothetical protein